MIVTKLNGGLGNQMFQYAAARRAAIVNHVPLKLDLSYYQPDKKNKRQYELNIFRIQATIAHPFECWATKVLPNLGFGKVIKERAFQFDKRVLEAPGSSYFECDSYFGYWQSYKYFDDVADIIRKDFTFKIKVSPRNKPILEQIKKSNSVFVHIRLGDYVTKYKNVYAQLGRKYYSQSLKIISQRLSHPKIFLLCEDPKWVKKNFPPVPIVQVVSQTSVRDWEEYLLMVTFCRHAIIANSTFSWWGAWLQSPPRKIVIAPKSWFADPAKDSRDLFPDSWIKI